jgi:hypothetical protein
VMSVMISELKRMFGSSLPPVVKKKNFFVGGLMSYLCYLFLFVYSGVQHILCCVFLVLSMLPVSLQSPFLIAPLVFKFIY